MDTDKLFSLRGSISKTLSLRIEVLGAVFFLLLWQTICSMGLIPKTLLPSPFAVITSFKELHFENFLIENTVKSIKLNVLGYIESVLISLALGFPIGLFPVFRSLFSRYINSIRFLPLTAVTGLFIAWFGIETNMKVQFLAFGIIVYLLPVVVQRIDEVETEYIQAVYTLGATKWQIIKTVFVPHVLSKISDDIRVLVAISWTYIIVAELMNNQGGIGSLTYMAARMGRLDKVFAILLVIIAIGFIQDRIFHFVDKKLFPHKHT